MKMKFEKSVSLIAAVTALLAVALAPLSSTAEQVVGRKDLVSPTELKTQENKLTSVSLEALHKSAEKAATHNASIANNNELTLNCPLRSCLVVKQFQLGAQKWNPGHRGVDLSAAKSRAVYAPADGEVIYAGILVNRSVVSIRHEDDFRSTFEPVLPLVTVGDQVQRGELVALVIDQHCDEEKCLHWGFKLGADGYLNPMDFLKRKQVRLLS